MSNKNSDTDITIRRANIEDMLTINAMVTYLQRDGFESSPPAFKCLIAELKKRAGTIVADYATIYYPIYSTWEGRSMLENLYVRTCERRRGIGTRLFDAVANEAYFEGCCRLDFHVLAWNSAISFYERKGAVNLTRTEQWCLYRLTGEALERAAQNREKKN